MAKKYLNLEEAAEMLGLETSQLMRMREQGEIRGFADRGSWKFREQDVQEVLRNSQADSSPEIPLMNLDEEAGSGINLDSVLADEESGDLGASDSDVRLFFDEALLGDDEEEDLTVSTSDVSLVGDSGPQLDTDSDSDVELIGFEADSAVELSDSDSDVQIMGDAAESDIDLSGSDSDVQLVGGTEPDISLFAEESAASILSDSDSDVRLSDDDSDSDVLLVGVDSDSDVKLIDPDSDSDVSLSGGLDGTDSDIRLMQSADSPTPLAELDQTAFGEVTADSDLRLGEADDSPAPASDLDQTAYGDIGADSDLRLGDAADSPAPASDLDRTSVGDINADSDLRLGDADSPKPAADLDVTDFGDSGADSDLKLIDESSPSAVSIDDESGISLEIDESGISLEIDDSGISLDADDSGISLESFDSGAVFDDDSGISLEADDSGISLESLGDDSGISLEADGSGIALLADDDDSGISMEDDYSAGDQTMPMMAIPGAAEELAESGLETTSMEAVKPGVGEDSDFELAGLEEDETVGTDTSVLKFDDSGEMDQATGLMDSVDEQDALDFDDEVDDTYDEGAEYDDELEDEFEDDLDDVFDADEDFEDEEGDFESGSSQFDVDSPAAAAMAGAVAYGAVENDWGIGTKVMMGFGTLFSLTCTLVGFELVRTMWLWNQPGKASSSILDMIGGLFG